MCYPTKCKYLGHIINNNLTDDDDIARQKRCFYAHANVLARKFRFCSSGIKNVLFHSYCGTMYTSSLWCKFKKQSLKSVNVAYNNSFRILHHLPSRCSASFMFVSNHIKSFKELIRSSHLLRKRTIVWNSAGYPTTSTADTKLCRSPDNTDAEVRTHHASVAPPPLVTDSSTDSIQSTCVDLLCSECHCT